MTGKLYSNKTSGENRPHQKQLRKDLWGHMGLRRGGGLGVLTVLAVSLHNAFYTSASGDGG